jgi:beta-xylosidase
MKIKIHLFICVAFCSQFFVFGNQQYTNPILHPTNFAMDSAADPFVFKDDDGTYYMYVTSQGYPCFSSKDLVNWTYAGNVFRKATAKWATQKFWAPELVKVGSTYYLHYSAAADDGIMRIGMAKSTSPKGPFQDISNKPFFQQGIDKGCIDSHIFFDDDGSVYMYYSNGMSTNPIPGTNKKRSEIWVVELSTDLTETIGEAKRLFFPSQSWEKNPTAQNYWNEAPSAIKHDNKYYILYSANSYSSSDYAIGYATSDSPLGPFTKYAYNPILSNKGREAYVSGTGHQSVVTSPDETEMFCVYHSHIDLVAQGGERMVNIDRMGFSDDGLLYITGPTVTPQPYPSDNALDIRGIKELKLTLKIQPNPATNYIQIDMPFNASHVSIYSADGLLHYSLPISENKTIIQIPVVSFPSGMYIVRIKDSKMNKLVGKFMKN